MFNSKKKQPAESNLEKAFQEYNLVMLKTALQILQDYHLAEDATQNAFLNVLRKNPDDFYVQPGHNLRAYFVIIVKRAAVDIYRKRREIPVDPEDKILNFLESPENFTITEGQLDLVRDALQELPDDYKDPLLLKYVYGHSEKEIAEIFGLSYEAMRKRIQRTKQMIRKGLQKGGNGNDDIR